MGAGLLHAVKHMDIGVNQAKIEFHRKGAKD
jgi:hypothetical protein